MFERFNVAGLYLADRALMSLYGYGQHLSGVIVDFGLDAFTVVPVVDALVQHHAICRTSFGRRDVVKYLLQLLKEEASSSNVLSLLDYEFGDHVLETVAETSVALFERREKDAAKVALHYKSHDLQIGESRVKVMEMPFNPKIANLHEVASITDCIYTSIYRCDADKRKSLLDHVILCGSFVKTKGIKCLKAMV